MSDRPAPDVHGEQGKQAAHGDGLTPVTVRLRGETVRQLRATAAREGASLEAVAALWLEEHADLVRSGPAPARAHQDPSHQ